MSKAPRFEFGDDSVAGAYDAVLVPTLFQQWAARLVEQHAPWEGRRVLDLATGSGIVAQLVGEQVGHGGKVLGADVNGEMLCVARLRCAHVTPVVEFIETPAHPLDVSGDSIDFVVCQQGLQFFPNKGAAAREMHRVLRQGGKVVATTWQPVTECRAFGIVCDALDSIGEPEIASTMRVPFDNLPRAELVDHFESAGFASVELEQQEQELVVEGGPSQAIQVAYATPIGPLLRALPEECQERFQQELTALIYEHTDDGTSMGRMVSNVLTAEKAA